MRRLLITAVTLFVAGAVPATASAVPPTVTARAASDITLTSATVNGTVDPQAAATTYYVEYGTTDSYGLKTSERDAGSGDAPVDVSVGLAGLTTDTTYHYRIVATNLAGIGRSADRTVRTARPPQIPIAITGASRDLTATTVTVAGTVNPRSQATRYVFEYGTGQSYSQRSAPVDVGAGGRAVAVSAALTGLTPNTRYGYRLSATNATGTATGLRRSFLTARGATTLTFSLKSTRVPYQGSAVVSGTATSPGSGPMTVALERQAFPYAKPFTRVGSARTTAAGAFSFTLSPLLITSRLRVVTGTPPGTATPAGTNPAPLVTSAVRTVRTTVRVGLSIKRLGGGRIRFTGSFQPGVSGSRASLQRRARGRFITVRRAAVRRAGVARSTFKVTIRGPRKKTTYRVFVTPPRSSGHAGGASRTRLVGARRGR